MSVVFECAKDPVLAKFYEEKFGYQFRCDVAYNLMTGANSGRPWEELITEWNTMMLTEAARQQHYDFALVGDGDFIPHRRVVLREGDGSPQLLIPTVRIQP